MRLLLDTHAFLWWVAGSERLSMTARRAIADDTNDIVVSAASAWEVATKFRIGKLAEAAALARDISGRIADRGFRGAIDLRRRRRPRRRASGPSPGPVRQDPHRPGARAEHRPRLQRDAVRPLRRPPPLVSGAQRIRRRNMLREAAKAPALPDIPAPAALGTGVLPCQALEGLVARRVLDADPPIAPERIQPAGIDLRLGARAWRSCGFGAATCRARRCAADRAAAAVHAIRGRASR